MAFDYRSFEHQIAVELSRRHDLPRRLDLVESVLSAQRPDPAKVLRHHSDGWVRHRDVLKRDEVDYLLDGLSAIYVGGAADELFSAPEDGAETVEAPRVAEALGNEDLSRYFEKHYPIALPALLRAHLNQELPATFEEGLRGERSIKGWKAAFLQFMELDAAFAGESPFVDFLALLDDIRVGGYWLNDLRHALQKPKVLKRWMRSPTGRRLLEGFQDFFEFSETLDHLLSEMDEMPLHRGLIWLHFGYWYGGGGKRMRDTARWLVGALAELPKVYQSADTAALEALMGRLTDPTFYAGHVIGLAGHALDRWRENAFSERVVLRLR